MTDRKRPDPRQHSLPEGYELQFKMKAHEDEESYIQRVLAQGEAGKRLLLDPDFNAAYQEILEEQLAQLVNSKPGQAELRDDCYYRVRGIQEIAYKLNTWVAHAEQVKQKLVSDAEQENRE